MRANYLVTYDIKDEKRLRKVYIKMRGFGEPIQYSVFICRLSLIEKMLMISNLLPIIKPQEDSIMVVNLGNTLEAEWSKIEFIGVKRELDTMGRLVI